MTLEELEKEIKHLEDCIFYHKMIDRWTEEDFELAKKMELELSSLKEKKEGIINDNNNK